MLNTLNLVPFQSDHIQRDCRASVLVTARMA